MNNQKNLNTIKAINRKKFFLRISNGIAGLFIAGLFPINLFGKNDVKSKKSIKINPLAVKREKDFKKNG